MNGVRAEDPALARDQMRAVISRLVWALSVGEVDN